MSKVQEIQKAVPPDPWYSIGGASAYCSCHPQTIRTAARLGELTHSRSGPLGHYRFKQSELDRWMKRNEIPARKGGAGGKKGGKRGC